eukprot:scaffold7243_cov394-Prasinococcus_capsulatus_cf.AAC.7
MHVRDAQEDMAQCLPWRSQADLAVSPVVQDRKELECSSLRRLTRDVPLSPRRAFDGLRLA